MSTKEDNLTTSFRNVDGSGSPGLFAHKDALSTRTNRRSWKKIRSDSRRLERQLARLVQGEIFIWLKFLAVRLVETNTTAALSNLFPLGKRFFGIEHVRRGKNADESSALTAG
jgi:hypothetical protein